MAILIGGYFIYSRVSEKVFALWIETIYLLKEDKYKYGSLITAIPAAFMTAVVATYIFSEPNMTFGVFIPMWVGYIIGGSLALGGFIVYLVFLLKRKVLVKEEFHSSSLKTLFIYRVIHPIYNIFIRFLL